MNERITRYRAECRIAEAKARIEARKAEAEARDLDNRCPDCERSYTGEAVCACDHD